MSQGHIKKQPAKVDPAKISATLNNFLVIRLVVASVIFAVALILTLPAFVRIILLVLSAVLAGYDIIRKAVDASLDQNVRTPEIQVEGGEKYGTKEVGQWIVDFIKKA